MNYDFLWTGLLIFTILWAFSEIKKWLSHRNIKDTTSFQLTANENNEWRRTQAKAVTIENIKDEKKQKKALSILEQNHLSIMEKTHNDLQYNTKF